MKLTVTKWEAKAGNELTANGLVRINPNKTEFGSLMLIAVVASLSNGFMNVKNKVGFIVGKVTDLETLVANFNLKDGDDFSAKCGPHRIVTIEKVFSQIGKELGFREKINPQTKEKLSKDGEIIMWKTEIVPDGSDVYDTFIKHDVAAVISTVDESVEEFAGAADFAARK